MRVINLDILLGYVRYIQRYIFIDIYLDKINQLNSTGKRQVYVTIRFIS